MIDCASPVPVLFVGGLLLSIATATSAEVIYELTPTTVIEHEVTATGLNPGTRCRRKETPVAGAEEVDLRIVSGSVRTVYAGQVEARHLEKEHVFSIRIAVADPRVRFLAVEPYYSELFLPGMNEPVKSSALYPADLKDRLVNTVRVAEPYDPQKPFIWEKTKAASARFLILTALDENKIALRRRIIDWRSTFQDLSKPVMQQRKSVSPPGFRPGSFKFEWGKTNPPEAETENGASEPGGKSDGDKETDSQK